MSYILDALRKSEKERQRGNVPDPLTVQEVAMQETKKHPLRLYLVLTVLLISAGFLTFWLGLWQAKNPDIAGVQTVKKNAESVTPETPVTELPHQKPLSEIKKEDITSVVPQKQSIKNEASLHKQDKNKMITSGVSEKPHVIQPTASQVESSGQASPDAKTEEHVEPPIPNKIYHLNELPQAIRKNLPAFTISISFYSDDPSSRMVRVNGQSLREGQELAAGLKLEQITANGIIFNYQQYRFLVGEK